MKPVQSFLIKIGLDKVYLFFVDFACVYFDVSFYSLKLKDSWN